MKAVGGHLAFLVVLAMLTSCTNDHGSTVQSTTQSSVTSKTPAPTTTVGSSTEQTESTTTTAAAPVTTAAAPVTMRSSPPDTQNGDAATKAAVASAIARSRQDYIYAVGNYDAPDALEVLRRTWSEGGPSWDLVLRTMQSMQSNGYRLRPNGSVPDASMVEGEVKLLDGPPATRAEVQVCTVSSDIVFKPGAAPDGSDVTINDAVVSRRTRVTLVFQDGAWKAYEGTILGTWDGQSSCPAA
jgi:hypothetical protein